MSKPETSPELMRALDVLSRLPTPPKTPPSVSTEPRCCGACDFFRGAEQEGPGECRHRSPRAVEDRRSGAWRSQWPPVWPHEWCGAFQPKEPEEPTDERA